MEVRVMLKKNGDKVFQMFKVDKWVNIPQVNEQEVVDEEYVDKIHEEISIHSIFKALQRKSEATIAKTLINRTHVYYWLDPKFAEWEVGVVHEESISQGKSIIIKDTYTIGGKVHSPRFFADLIMKSFIDLYIAKDIESVLNEK
jgi:diphthamide biosynthesis methyltransferase